MKNGNKRFLSILFSLVLVLGLMPGMSLTAYADQATPIHIFNATIQGKTIGKRNEKTVPADPPFPKIPKSCQCLSVFVSVCHIENMSSM